MIHILVFGMPKSKDETSEIAKTFAIIANSQMKIEGNYYRFYHGLATKS